MSSLFLRRRDEGRRDRIGSIRTAALSQKPPVRGVRAPPHLATASCPFGQGALDGRDLVVTDGRPVRAERPPSTDPSLLVIDVASDDPLARRSLAFALREQFERAHVRALGPSSPRDDAPAADVCVWDLGHDPRAALDRLQSAPGPMVPVVALVPSAAPVRAALAWGARAVLPRDAPDDVLAAAVRAVERGLSVLAPPFADDLFARDEVTAPSSAEALPAREREVLGLIAEGMPNKLIAHTLGISEHTVKFHVNAVMARLGAQSRTEAVVRAARRGLLVL